MRPQPAFISCGLGDFISIESYLTDEEKETVTGFYLFTRAARPIMQLIRSHPLWRHLPVTIPFEPGEIRALNTYSFFRIPSVFKLTKEPPERFGYLYDCRDWAGDSLYPGILQGTRRYNGTGWDYLEGLESTGLILDRASYADDRLVRKGRNLSPAEVRGLVEDQPYTPIGVGYTDLLEAMQLIKGASDFIGVDSAMAAWAARCDNLARIRVKTVNPIYLKWKKIYDPFDRIEIVNSSL